MHGAYRALTRPRAAQGCFGLNACSGTTVMRVISSAGCGGALPPPPPRGTVSPPPPRLALPPPPLPPACPPYSGIATSSASRNASTLCPLTLAGGMTYRISVDCNSFEGVRALVMAIAAAACMR
jgi:hypothetical protein